MPTKSRFPIIRTRWPRIVDYRTTRMGCFMVDGRRSGNGRREYFKELQAAKTRADQLAIERENHGVAALNFPARDRVMAVECRELLAPFGLTIRDATLHFIDHLESERAKNTVPTIRHAAIEYLAQRERDVERGDLAHCSLVESRRCLNQLSATVGDLRVCDFSSDQLKTYVDSFPVSAKTRQNLRLRLSGFFSFAKSRTWISENPCADLKIRVPRKEIFVLSIEACEHLLRTAEESKHAATLVPYLACGLFAAMRPSESQRLDWSNVDFETGHIRVLPHTSKTREGRFVTMEPTLIAWLHPYRKPSGPVVSRNHRKQWDALMAAAGYGPENPWKQDAMRHTGCSMLLAIKRNRALVAEECGHSIATLRKHYRVPIKQGDAERFWRIMPRITTLTQDSLS